jgi:hypothetical protein
MVSELTEEQVAVLDEYIKTGFIARSTPNRRTSYSLKHIFENSRNGFYVTNNQFKAAMERCGFDPVKRSAEDWRFRISERSPAIQNTLMKMAGCS